jgi:molybdopterin synthase sulfur carrier subunit
MSITVQYFASLKERLGRSSDSVNVTQPLSAVAVWQQLNPDVALPSAVLVAVNGEYATLEALVHSGDELAFFHTVTGG